MRGEMSEASDNQPEEQQRPIMKALIRGIRMRYPNCGQGALFYKYLKLNEHCSSCGTEIGVIRADDMPAYITIVIVGHIVVPLAVMVERFYSPSTLVHMALWVPMIILMTLGFLPAVKGATVALMWRLGLRGDER